jgi:hypothetical protein
MKQKLVVTNTIRVTELPALVNSWATNTPSVKMLRPQNIAPSYTFVETLQASMLIY